MRERQHDADEPFPSAKLERIQASLERQGVAFVTGDDGAALAQAFGAEALYWPDMGRPGFIGWGRAPSVAAVLEELIHLGQHRRASWRDLTGQIPALEVAAHDRLLRLGERWGWSPEPLGWLRRARARWQART
jgi:hypothetical protein